MEICGLKADRDVFFDTTSLEYLQSNKLRKDLLMKLDWINKVTEEQYLVILVSCWFEMEDIYMEREDYYNGDIREVENFMRVIKYSKNKYSNNIKIQLILGYMFAVTDYLFWGDFIDSKKLRNLGKNMIEGLYTRIKSEMTYYFYWALLDARKNKEKEKYIKYIGEKLFPSQLEADVYFREIGQKK